MTNTHEVTGIPYGIISCNSLDQEWMHELLFVHGKDLSYAAALQEEEDRQRAEFDAALEVVNTYGVWSNIDNQPEFRANLDNFEPCIDEPIVEGECEGVKYRTTWLGGAQMLWVFESPHVGRFAQCSPCVPGAADLDSPDEDGIEGYDVPPDWRYKEPA